MSAITAVEYSEPTNETFVYTNNSQIPMATIAGEQTYTTYCQLLELQKSVLSFDELSKLSDNLAKVMEFHYKSPHPEHPIIDLIKNADKMIELASKVKPTDDQLSLFDQMSESTLN